MLALLGRRSETRLRSFVPSLRMEPNLPLPSRTPERGVGGSTQELPEDEVWPPELSPAEEMSLESADREMASVVLGNFHAPGIHSTLVDEEFSEPHSCSRSLEDVDPAVVLQESESPPGSRWLLSFLAGPATQASSWASCAYHIEFSASCTAASPHGRIGGAELNKGGPRIIGAGPLTEPKRVLVKSV